MTEENTFAEKWALGTVPEKIGPYEEGSRWAEPGRDDAAWLTRLVVEDRRPAARISGQAARDIGDLQKPGVAGAPIREVLERRAAEWRLRG